MTIYAKRRAFILGSSALVAGSAVGLRPAFAQTTELRVFWWGSEVRRQKQMAINRAYESQHENVSVLGNSAPFNDYWPLLATQVAAGNAPDVINMDYRYLAEYAGRGVLLPLDDLIDELNVADFGSALDGGRVDGKLYAIPTGVNAPAVIVNEGAYEEAGVTAPYAGMTWEEYAANAAELTAKTERPHYYGASDGSGREPVLEVWLRQRGKSLYTADGALGFGTEDAVEWFQMWQDMREAEAIPPAEIVALDQDTFETGLINTGYAATNYAFSSNLVGYQELNEEDLSAVVYPVPSENPQPGIYLKPAMLFSINAKSELVEQAADYIGFMLTDPSVVSIMGLERGVPVSPAVREQIAPDLDPTNRESLDYIGDLTEEHLGDLPPLPPQGAGEAESVLLRLSEEVGFGATSPRAAGEQLVREVTAVLERG